MKKEIKTKVTRKQNILRFMTKSVWVVAAIELIVLGVLYARQLSPSFDNAIAMATTVKPETFTELYFEDHLSLPAKIAYNQQNTFKFTIHNLENKNITYPYEVYIECLQISCNGQKQMIDKGNITLKNDEYKTIDENYTITLPTARIKVIVNLINKNQKIDFWIQDL